MHNNPLNYGAKLYINGVEQTNITIPSDITEIKHGTFSGCTSLTSVTIPNSVTEIGDYAFYDCTSLKSVTIGNGVTSIRECAFDGCTSLTSITIPDSVTEIGNGAFHNCTSLTSVTIPKSVTSIREYAFSGCTSLTSITIPESVTWIGKYAFRDCTSLTSVTIPNSDIGIAEYAFYNCTGELIINSKRIVEPDSYTFWNKDSKFTKLTIGDNITKIGYTFHGCTSLESVTIGNGVTEIGKSAFSGCTSLTSVTIPNSVTEIGKSAFWECSSLTSVTIPESVTKIGEWVFASCTSLASVYCKATTPPSGDRYMFYKSASDRKIYVPRNSVDAYKSAEFWSDYADYIEGYDFQLNLRVQYVKKSAGAFVLALFFVYLHYKTEETDEEKDISCGDCRCRSFDADKGKRADIRQAERPLRRRWRYQPTARICGRPALLGVD